MRPRNAAALAAGVLSIPALAAFLATGGDGPGHGRRVVYADVSFEVPEGWRYDVFSDGGAIVGDAGQVNFRLDVGPVGQLDPAQWQRIEVGGRTAYSAEGTRDGAYVRQVVVPDGPLFELRADATRLGQVLPAFDEILESVRIVG